MFASPWTRNFKPNIETCVQLLAKRPISLLNLCHFPRFPSCIYHSWSLRKLMRHLVETSLSKVLKSAFPSMRHVTSPSSAYLSTKPTGFWRFHVRKGQTPNPFPSHIALSRLFFFLIASHFPRLFSFVFTRSDNVDLQSARSMTKDFRMLDLCSSFCSSLFT